MTLLLLALALASWLSDNAPYVYMLHPNFWKLFPFLSRHFSLRPLSFSVVQLCLCLNRHSPILDSALPLLLTFLDFFCVQVLKTLKLSYNPYLHRSTTLRCLIILIPCLRGQDTSSLYCWLSSHDGPRPLSPKMQPQKPPHLSSAPMTSPAPSQLDVHINIPLSKPPVREEHPNSQHPQSHP